MYLIFLRECELPFKFLNILAKKIVAYYRGIHAYNKHILIATFKINVYIVLLRSIKKTYQLQ